MLTGSFNKTGIIGMLVASYYEALDMLSPSIEAVIDELCGPNYGSITMPFILYGDLLGFVHRRVVRHGWTESDLEKLSKI